MSHVPVAVHNEDEVDSMEEVTSVQTIHELMKNVRESHSDVYFGTGLLSVLHDETALAVMLSYITRIIGHDVENHAILDGPSERLTESILEVRTNPDRDSTSGDVTPELLSSYKATMLLTDDAAKEPPMTYFLKMSKLITKCIFPIFQKNSQGNLRHGCRVIDHLMRLYLDDVYEVIGRNASTAKRYMGSMLQYIEHAPVAEIFLTLICKPQNASMIRMYKSTPQKKWQFFRALSEWKLLLVLAEHVYGTSYSEAHTIGAADVFVELLDRLSADENGALLLQPAAYCPELLEGLISTAVDTKLTRSAGQRTAAMKCVFRLLQRSALEKVQGPPTSPYQSFGGTIVNLVPNQLAPLRDRIYDLAEKDMGKMLRYLIEKYQDQQNIEMDLDSGKPLPEGAVRHTAYVVKVPFTEFRLTLVETLVELIAHHPSRMDEYFDVNVWRVLTHWFFEYAHNNLYHAAYYQLVFIALRSDNQATLEILVKKLKLVTSLIEYYRNEQICTSNKGYILQCCNAIRLQAASQPPDAFLRNFLKSHTTWRSFEPELRAHTTKICDQGLGFAVPQSMRPGSYQQKDTWQMLDEARGIDHGSDYARSLGFVDDVAWPEDHEVSETSKKKKKKKKGKKKTSENGEDDNDDDDDGVSETSSVADSESRTSSSATGNGTPTEEDDDDDESSSTADPTTTTSKKNKKKKKKSKGKK